MGHLCFNTTFTKKKKQKPLLEIQKRCFRTNKRQRDRSLEKGKNGTTPALNFFTESNKSPLVKPGPRAPFPEPPTGAPFSKPTTPQPALAAPFAGATFLTPTLAPPRTAGSLRHQPTSHLGNDCRLCFLLQELWKVTTRGSNSLRPNLSRETRSWHTLLGALGRLRQVGLGSCSKPRNSSPSPDSPLTPFRRSMCGNGRESSGSGIWMLRVVGSLDAKWEHLPPQLHDHDGQQIIRCTYRGHCDHTLQTRALPAQYFIRQPKCYDRKWTSYWVEGNEICVYIRRKLTGKTVQLTGLCGLFCLCIWAFHIFNTGFCAVDSFLSLLTCKDFLREREREMWSDGQSSKHTNLP